jgi:putative polyhydroxyalkanoate system protein
MGYRDETIFSFVLANRNACLLNCYDSQETNINMSTIDIHAYHTLSHEEALNAADELSIDLAKKFGIDYGWDDEVIHFERPGVSGQILVQETELRIQAELGFMLMMLKGPIEQEIMRYLEQHFGCSFDVV